MSHKLLKSALAIAVMVPVASFAMERLERPKADAKASAVIKNGRVALDAKAGDPSAKTISTIHVDITSTLPNDDHTISLHDGCYDRPNGKICTKMAGSSNFHDTVPAGESAGGSLTFRSTKSSRPPAYHCPDSTKACVGLTVSNMSGCTWAIDRKAVFDEKNPINKTLRLSIEKGGCSLK